MNFKKALVAMGSGILLAGAAWAQTPAPTTADQGAASGSPSQVGGEMRSAIGQAVEGETPAGALANGMDLTPDHMENGRWYNADGIPVPNIEADGTVDYATFSGYRRYHAECHVCHGPDGEGSTYAPALKNSVLTLDYYDYMQIVASGKQNVGAGQANQVMPAFGTNRNVWCYVDDIYVYLLAHGTGEVPRGRPAKRADKSDEFTAQENSCMDG